MHIESPAESGHIYSRMEGDHARPFSIFSGLNMMSIFMKYVDIGGIRTSLQQQRPFSY
jgi:hypothetical protein